MRPRVAPAERQRRMQTFVCSLGAERERKLGGEPCKRVDTMMALPAIAEREPLFSSPRGRLPYQDGARRFTLEAVPQREHRVRGEEHQKRRGERYVHEEPAVQPVVKPSLDGQVAPLGRHVGQVARGLVEHRG